MRAWADVAVLTARKNVNGGLVARCAPGLPFLLSEGAEVAFVPPVLDMPRRARVEEVRPLDGASAVVRFSGIDDADTAGALVGCHCLRRRAELPELARAAAAARADEAEGWEVRDVRAGRVGTLLRVEERPAQDLLVVRRDAAAGATGAAVADAAAGASPEVLIPLVDEIVLHVDDEARTIEVDLPAGLLDL